MADVAGTQGNAFVRDIKCSAYYSGNKKFYDLSSVILSVNLETSITGQPGKCRIKMLNTTADPKRKFEAWRGCTIAIKYGGWAFFKGVIFEVEQSEKALEIDLICYDTIRYMANKDAYLFKKKTASDIFKKVCKDFAIPYTVQNKSTYKCKKKSQDNKTLWSMCDDAIQETLGKKNKMYVIWDKFGKATFSNVASLKSKYMIIAGSNVISYKWNIGIDKNTYTQIKGYTNNKKTEKRTSYVSYSKDKVKKWGLLQRYEHFHDDTKKKTLKKYVKQLLKNCAHEWGMLDVTCFGIPNLHAGCLIYVRVPLLGVKDNHNLLVQQCEHTITNGKFITKISGTIIV